MGKNIVFAAVLLLLLLLFSSCKGEMSGAPDTTDDATDTTPTDTTYDTTDTSTPDTDTNTPDTTDTAHDVDEPKLSLPTKEDWEALNLYNGSWYHAYHAIVALLSGDIDSFAKYCSVSPDIYDSLRGMVIDDYTLTSEEIFYVSDPRPFPILEIEVSESNSEFLPVGVHKLVFDEGLVLRFFKYEDFPPKSNGFQFAASYIFALCSDRDFYSIQAENRRQFGLCDFIVSRLNTLAGNYEPRSEAEIRAYAEKYLGVDGDTLYIEQTLEADDGGYQRIGRGHGSYEFTVLSEEVIDGVNVVTVRFFADFSKTMPSRTVEFYMELVDGEYRPIKAVTIEDSEFETAFVSP